MTPGRGPGRDLAATLLVFIAAAMIYLPLRERVCFFDGISYASAARTAIEDPSRTMDLFRVPKAYAYLPAVYLATRTARAIGLEIDPYRVMQIASSLAAAAALALFHLLLRTLGAGRMTAIAAAGMLGVSAGYWENALRGQPHLIGQVLAAGALGAASLFTRNPTTMRLAGIAVLSAAAMLVHVSNAIVVLPVVVTIASAAKERRAANALTYLAVTAILAGIAPAVTYRLHDPESFRYTFVNAVDSTEHHDSGFFDAPRVDEAVANVPLMFAGSIFALREPGIASTTAGILVFVLAAFSARAVIGSTSPETRRAAMPWLLALVVYALFFSIRRFWQFHHWVVVPMAIVLLGALAASRIAEALDARRRRALAFATAAAIFSLGFATWSERISTITAPDYNDEIAVAERIERETAPGSVILLAGGGAPDNNMKAYLWYFGRREWLAIDYLMMTTPRASRPGLLARRVAGLLASGRSIHATGCFLDVPTQARLAGEYGISLPELMPEPPPFRIVRSEFYPAFTLAELRGIRNTAE